MFLLWILYFAAASLSTTLVVSSKMLSSLKKRIEYVDPCDRVCVDLPKDDLEPVCMMFSRYKRGYQHFVNLCHARRAICFENLVLHMVHPSRCVKSGQFYMPVD